MFSEIIFIVTLIGLVMILAYVIVSDILEKYQEKMRYKEDKKKNDKEQEINETAEKMKSTMEAFHTFVDDIGRFNNMMKGMKDVKDDEKEDNKDNIKPGNIRVHMYDLPLKFREKEYLEMANMDVSHLTPDSFNTLVCSSFYYDSCFAFIFQNYILAYKPCPTKVRERFRVIYRFCGMHGQISCLQKHMFHQISDVIEPSTDELVNEIIDLKWGVGSDRKKRLRDAGYDCERLQALVNKEVARRANQPFYLE